MRLGDILLGADLITKDLLERALSRQKVTGERLGPLLVSMGACQQTQIDDAWMKSIVTPAVEGAIDRACFNRFTQQPNRKISYTRVHRRQQMLDDMLDACRPLQSDCFIEGIAQAEVEGSRPMTINFVLDTSIGFAEIDDESDENIRLWMNEQSGKSATGKLANDAGKKAAELLKGGNGVMGEAA